MSHTFVLDKIETRSAEENGVPQYIVRGYASIPDQPYVYKYEKNSKGEPIRTFSEMFTQQGITNIKRKAQFKKIFVDAEHLTGLHFNTKKILKAMESSSGKDFSGDINQIMAGLKTHDLPLAKIHEIKIDDKGLFFDTRLNPNFRNIDEKHKRYFDAVWGSLQSGFLNSMSFNFKATDVTSDRVPKINDADVYGISYTGSGAGGAVGTTITEVALRSAMEVRGETTMEKEEVDKMKKELEDMKKAKAEADQKLEETKKAEADAKENADKLSWEEERKSHKAQMDELNKKLEEVTKKTEEITSQRKGLVNPEEKFKKQENTDVSPAMTEVAKKVEEAFKDVPDVKQYGSNIGRWGHYKSPASERTPEGLLGQALALQAQVGSHKQTDYDDPLLRKDSKDIIA